METNQHIKYTQSLLDETLKRYEATLVGEYDKINGSLRINFICKCGKENSKIFTSAHLQGGFKCKECTNKQRYETYKRNNLEKYGVENLFQLKDIKEKLKQTNLEKYGVENPSQNKEIKEKKIQTTLKNYGVKNPKQSEEIKEKAEETCLKNYGVKYALQNEEIKNQTKRTNLEKYGVVCTMSSEMSKEKAKETCLKKYGVEHSSKSEEVKEKSKKTNLERYGVEYSSQYEGFKEKVKSSNLKKYGVEHPSQNQEYMERIQKNAKKYKKYIMPSGAIRLVQGYEPFALDILVKEFTEDQIVTERSQIPRISYMVKDKQKYYFPDIFLPHLHKIIEVKSTWTYKCKLDNVFVKEKATKELEYDYEFWVFDKTGKRLSEEELLFI
jgi:hypothetical protein